MINIKLFSTVFMHTHKYVLCGQTIMHHQHIPQAVVAHQTWPQTITHDHILTFWIIVVFPDVTHERLECVVHLLTHVTLLFDVCMGLLMLYKMALVHCTELTLVTMVILACVLPHVCVEITQKYKNSLLWDQGLFFQLNFLHKHQGMKIHNTHSVPFIRDTKTAFKYKLQIINF